MVHLTGVVAFGWKNCRKYQDFDIEAACYTPTFMWTDCASAHLTVQFHSSVLTIRIEIITGHKASMTISKSHTDNIGTVIVCVL